MSSKREFNLYNIINALYEAEFAAAHWEALGVQLNRPPARLANIGADRSGVDDKLSSMITQWLRSDLNASWESLAAALNRTPGYGPATEARFRRAAGLSDGGSGQDEQKVKDHALRKREVTGTDQGHTDGAETQPSRPRLAAQSSVESTVPLPASSPGPDLLRIFCFVIFLIVSVLVIVALFIKVVEKYM